MKLYERLNKLQSGLLIAFLFSSVIIAVNEVLLLLSSGTNEKFNYAADSFRDLFSKLVVYIFCYFLTVYLTNGKKWLKGFWSLLCLAFFQTAFLCVYDAGNYYIIAIVVALITSFLFNRFGVTVSMSVSIIFSIVFGLLSGFLYEYFQNFLMSIARFISQKGLLSSVLFSVGDTFFSLFSVDNFSDLFFYKSYGGSRLINDTIVTGAKDLFEAGYKGQIISTYLSGHFYLLFAVAGMAVSMMSKLKNPQKFILIVLTTASVFSGNLSYLFLFIFLESPFLFVSVILLSVISYSAAFLLKLGMGYISNGGIVELIVYSDNYIYLIAGGVILFVIGYFMFKFSYEKHAISDCINIYIPTRLASIVDALGGIENIVRFKDGKLEVRNPKLINTVKFECCIDENVVSSNSDKFKELSEYLTF